MTPGVVLWVHMVWSLYCANPTAPCREGWHCYKFFVRSNGIVHLCSIPWYQDLEDGWIRMDGGNAWVNLPQPPQRGRKQ